MICCRKGAGLESQPEPKAAARASDVLISMAGWTLQASNLERTVNLHLNWE
jgi:hypothetical protein